MQPKIIFIIFSLLIASAIPSKAQSAGRIQRVVIDAGHGGKDPGAVSPDRRFAEKDITLSVALRLGSMIKVKYPNIDVIYTRKTDVFIPLDKRTEIANKNKADLFISIHVNSARARSASGSETFVMGMDKSNSNLEVCKLENSVVVLEGEDYSSKYEGFDPNVPESYIIFSLLQNSHLEQSLLLASSIQNQLGKGPITENRGIKQGALLVLWKTTMPSVLVELGFISNSNDLRYLGNKESHVDFAYNLFKAFEDYKAQYEKTTVTDYVTTKPEQNQVAVATPVVAPIKDTNTQDSKIKAEESKLKTEKNIDDVKSKIKETLNSDKKATTPTQTTGTTTSTVAASTPPATTVITSTDKSNSELHFRIQIFASNRQLSGNSKEFKGYKTKYIFKDGFYKYNVGEYNSLDEAKRELGEVRRHFPQAFIIKIEGEKITPLYNVK